jgi:glycosyltransferase involved in cell wall biosynthesis
MTRRYRLHFVTFEYAGITHPYTGGIGKWIADFAPALVECGHEVRVLTSDPLVSEVLQTAQGVTVYRARVKSSNANVLTDLARGVGWQRFVRKWLLTQPAADLVIAPEYAGAAAAFAHAPHRPALVTQLHTSSEQAWSHSPGRRRGIRSALPGWLTRRREVRQATESDAIVGCSTAILDDTLRRWKLDPPFRGVIPNILDVGHTRMLADGSPPPLPAGRLVLFFGRMEPRKGTHVLAEAMGQVLERYPDVYLILAGSDRQWQGGSMVEYVRVSAGKHAERVIFLGELGPTTLMPLIRACDVVALPSLWEAFGFTILEAMALGRPVVSTSGHGADDFLTSGQEGLLVPSNDPQALADAINRLLDDGELRRALGAAAAKKAEQYGPEVGAQRASRVFDEILEGVDARRTSSKSV